MPCRHCPFGGIPGGEPIGPESWSIGRSSLIQAVRVAARGEAILSPRITRQLIDRYVGPGDSRADQAKQRLSVLTDKEREVVVLVGGGLSNGEIAKSLLMSEGTAKAHVSRILTKLDCTNRVQAAILAHDAGLLPPA